MEKYVHFHENACIFLVKMQGNARIFMKMHKTKFSELGLASSKGLFFQKTQLNLAPSARHLQIHHHDVTFS